MDLGTRTLEALDWPVLLERLAHHARTLAGAAAARQPDFAPTAAACRRRYAVVKEVRDLSDNNEHPPVGNVLNIGGLVERCAGGGVLEASELQEVAGTLRALVDLRRWLYDRAAEVPLLWNIAEPISVEMELLDLLESSFETSGELSGRTWPELGMLRQRVRSLKEKIRGTLEEIMRSSDFGEILQERFVTERGGRFVIPVKASHRKGLGIVHDRSNSGETVYVEPAEVVELHNQMTEAESDLAAEERRILTMLSRMVGKCGEPLLRSLAAAVQLDLAVARSALGEELRGIIPTVGEEGVLILNGGRHPILALRGIGVVPNDLRLDSAHPGLVLTGPNTGGKTVALKLLGLAAWMVRAGIPVPANDGSRVDFFDLILADIGDLQSVSGDLSTFSGHIQVVREVLRVARPGALVLLDEVAVGTDPAQGAALARAVMETCLEAGARLVVTTHYGELKVLPLTDNRFQVAAVLYEEGRPTYRVTVGLPGSSHALAIAGRLGLPTPVLERARTLLDNATRALDEAMERLEEERTQMLAREAELLQRLNEAQARLKTVEEREKRLEERTRNLEKDLLEGFKQKLRKKEDEVRTLVATLQANPEMKTANAALETIRATRAAATLGEPPTPQAPEPLQIGDQVRLRNVGSPGKVVTLSGERAEVQVGSLRLWAPVVELTRLNKGEVRKAERIRKAAVEEDRPAGPAPRVRTSYNTCDLRGQRVEEAMTEVDLFLDRMIRERQPVAFLLHGHGTGALKQAIRVWLPKCSSARSFRSADPDEGGDAYTLVELS